jgi:hypothetical protein
VLDDVLASARTDARTVLVASHELDRNRALATHEVVLTAGRTHGAVDATPEPEPARQ